MKNKRILIIGGTGALGKTLISTYNDFSDIMVFSRDEHKQVNLQKQYPNLTYQIGDVKDKDSILKAINSYKPEIVINTAALKHVPVCEVNPIESVQVNISGHQNLLDAVSVSNHKIETLVFISTDKAVKPRNILGITKRVGEILSQYFSKEKEYSNCRISIVRFGNVIGSDGSALPLFVNQIRQNLPISITDMKMKRYFMSIEEASRLVVQTSQIKLNGKIFVLDMGKQMRIIDIIKKLFEVFKKPNQTLKFNVIGNKFNEKISEKLFYKNKNFKTKFNKILFAKDPLPNKKSFFEFINKINHYLLLQEEKKLSLCLRNFFK